MWSAWTRLALLGALASGCTRPSLSTPTDLGSPTRPDITTKSVGLIEAFRSDVNGVSALSHTVGSGPGWLRVRWYVLYPRGLVPTALVELDGSELRLRASLTGVEAAVGGSDLVTYLTEVHRLPAGRLHLTGPHRLDRQIDMTAAPP